MSKRIVVCADGTWNRPEEDVESDVATNVLRLARAIKPVANDGKPQQVFYDWGVGSYHSRVSGGIAGRGIHKNIMDGYRYIVQNYSPGSEIFLFGFSRGAYTVRCICGLINNCGILKRPDARLIQEAFNHYKKIGPQYAPAGEKSVAFRSQHSHVSREVHFAGVWDTVGALGIPFSILGLFDRTDEFYDAKLGSNVRMARHALAIDERRQDFEPTIWDRRDNLDLKQVWFSGVHTDVGGGYAIDDNGLLASDYPLDWMMKEASKAGLSLESHLKSTLQLSAVAKLNRSRRHVFRLRRPLLRPIHDADADLGIHKSVKERWDADPNYRPANLVAYIGCHGWPQKLEA